jgi:glutaredoxin
VTGIVYVYGANWCPDCRRAKQFLTDWGVPFRWLDVEADQEARQYVLQVNGGRLIIPVVVFPEGDYLVEPTNGELAARLGLPPTRPAP